MRNLFSGLFICLLFIAPANAQPTTVKTLQASTPESAGMSAERLKRIDTMLTGWVEKERTNGAVALIIRKGKIVYHKAFGFDDAEKKDPIRTDDIYRIASQTKAITSVAAMMLYEEGKFLLDDPVSRYIPEFANPQVLDKFNAGDSSYTTAPARSEVTIRHLLTHTSGIGYAAIGSKEANAIYAKAEIPSGIGTGNGHTLASGMKRLAKLPLLHHPGERWTYGLNTDVLGYLVEVLSGMSLDQFFRTRIFEPLGMKDTYFNVPAAKHARVVNLFINNDGKLAKAPAVYNGTPVNYPQQGTSFFSGGAGLSSTALDYAIFLQMLLNGGEYGGRRLLARNTVRLMTTNQIGDVDFGAGKFGLGFRITTEKGSAVLPTPAGVFEWGGYFTTTYWADPKERLIGIIYRQQLGVNHPDAADKYKVMVYSAIND